MAALVIVGTASSGAMLFAGLALVGLLAVVTQTIVAFVATVAPAERGRAVGMVTSGIVIGILLARTISGVLKDLAGWRSVYLFSAALILLMVYI